MPLERAPTLRKDPQWLNDMLADKNSHIYFFWQGKFLYTNQTPFSFSNVKHADVDRELVGVAAFTLGLKHCDFTFLGLEDKTAHFVCDLSLCDETTLTIWLDTLAIKSFSFVDFRLSIPTLAPAKAAILSYSKSLIHWQHSVRFCGSCAAKTKSMDGGHRFSCSNRECNKDHFPRTDPVVIMLVEYQPETGPALCLLAEHHRTPEPVFSTLAGFVDPGESLQEAVVREVFEETGVKVSTVRFIDSQPWPFPNSLMLGFYAKATSMALTIEQEELRSAQWFSAKQLAEFKEWGSESGEAMLPRKESISRKLIDGWCEQQAGITRENS